MRRAHGQYTNLVPTVSEEPRRESKMRLWVAAVISVAFMATTAMGAAPAMAASGKPKLAVQETRGVGKTYLGAFSGDWTHCTYVTKAKYTQTANCSQGRSVSETISAHAGFTVASISSAVGFSVNYTTTVTASNSVTIRPGGHGWYDVGFRYQRYMIGMEHRWCTVPPGTCKAWSKPHWVTVQHHTGNTFHYFGTGAV
jgi:hypothetical protein